MIDAKSLLKIEESNPQTKTLNYILAYISIGQCGIGALYSKEIVLVMLLVLGGIAFLKNRKSVFNVLPWSLLITFIYIFQVMIYGATEKEYGKFGIAQIILLFARHTIPFMYLVVIGKNYYKYYIKIIYHLSIIGLVLWGLTSLVPPLDSFLRSQAIRFSIFTGSFVVDYKAVNLLFIYTFTFTGKFYTFARNAGPFWEPGAYAVYLGVAMVLLYFFTRSIRNKYHLVFIIAMLSTQSTAGYLTLFLFVFSTMLLSSSDYKFISLPLFLVLSILVFQYAPFLKEKVSQTVETETTRDIDTGAGGRLFAARKSLNAIQEYPIFGRGISRRTAVEYESEYAGAYGIVDMPARYGVIAGFIYILLLWKSMRYLSGVYFNARIVHYAFFMIISLLPVYFSQGVYGSVVNLLIMQTGLRYSSARHRNALNYGDKTSSHLST